MNSKCSQQEATVSKKEVLSCGKVGVNTGPPLPKAAAKASKAQPLLQSNQLVLNRFEVDGFIGGGGFAQVFRATDLTTGKKVAIKIESASEQRRMVLEFTLLALLRGQKHIPEIYGAEQVPTGHLLVMQLVGRSLSDIRRQMPQKRFSPSTLYRAAKQIGGAISIVHAAGFLHRDLKPPNCCIGAVDVGRIYLLDFGLCRQYIDSTGMVRRQRNTIGTRGTLRYMSLAGHARQELGPANDLVALLYTIVELGDGKLPWSKITQEKDIEKMKKQYMANKLCERQQKLIPLAKHIMGLSSVTIPDYSYILKEIEKCIPSGVAESDPYDWEIIPCELDLIKEEQTKEQANTTEGLENQCTPQAKDSNNSFARPGNTNVRPAKVQRTVSHGFEEVLSKDDAVRPLAVTASKPQTNKSKASHGKKMKSEQKMSLTTDSAKRTPNTPEGSLKHDKKPKSKEDQTKPLDSKKKNSKEDKSKPLDSNKKVSKDDVAVPLDSKKKVSKDEVAVPLDSKKKVSKDDVAVPLDSKKKVSKDDSLVPQDSKKRNSKEDITKQSKKRNSKDRVIDKSIQKQ